MTSNRRIHLRVPESRLITEFSRDIPRAASIINLSCDGLYTVRPCATLQSQRGVVQLEIPVPEQGESIWATGEILYEHHTEKSVGTGIRFRHMASCHRELLSLLVESGRQKVLRDMISHIRWEKTLSRYPTIFAAPPPPVTETTVPMFRLRDLRP